MRSILLISEGLGSKMGGPSETIPMFANHLSKSGVDIAIICPANNPPDGSVLNAVNIHEYKNIPVFIGKVIRFLKPKENEKYLHLNYLWRFEALIVLILGIIFEPKIILNPRGMLMDDAINSGNRLKEAIFKFFLKPIIMKSVFCFQASSRVEYESIKSIFPNKKIFLNTLGYQKRQKKSNLKIIPKEKYASRQLVVVSRLDRHKNIELIIKSFIESKCYENGWKLKIYGAVKKNDYLDFISPYSFDDLNIRNIFLDTFSVCNFFILFSKLIPAGFSLNEPSSSIFLSNFSAI